MGKQRKGLKIFYYFRLGYATYLALAIGIINILTSTYFLAIESVPILKSLFPSFESYVITAILIGIPVIGISGWFHYKRAGTYSAEISLGYQNDPYSYRWLPGYHQEVYGPSYLAILRANVKRVRGEKLTDDEINNMKKLEEQLTKLINGGYVGNPPKGAFR